MTIFKRLIVVAEIDRRYRKYGGGICISRARECSDKQLMKYLNQARKTHR